MAFTYSIPFREAACRRMLSVERVLDLAGELGVSVAVIGTATSTSTSSVAVMRFASGSTRFIGKMAEPRSRPEPRLQHRVLPRASKLVAPSTEPPETRESNPMRWALPHPEPRTFSQPGMRAKADFKT
jgi:hypothetical protein